jgi:hypothetical protein
MIKKLNSKAARASKTVGTYIAFNGEGLIKVDS